MIRISATLALLVCFSGCCENTAQQKDLPTVENAQADLIYNLDLPKNSKNVVALPGDNGWHTFDLELDGVKHHYLRHYVWRQNGTESLVEIPAKR